MARFWLWIVLISGIFCMINVSLQWYRGDSASWFVWIAAIFFSIDVTLDAIKELMGE